MSTAYTRRRVAGGEMALSCCALTKDGKHAVAGELARVGFFHLAPACSKVGLQIVFLGLFF